jgi:hypothetical protein
MPSYLQVENGEAAELQETAQAGASHKAENISTTSDDKARDISLDSNRNMEAMASAGKDTISIESESSLSRATVVALGGEEAATEFVDSFAAPFVGKYSAEFQMQLDDMKEMKATILKENGVADAMNENAVGKEQPEEMSKESELNMLPPTSLVISEGNGEQISHKLPFNSGRELEDETVVVEESPVRVGTRRPGILAESEEEGGAQVQIQHKPVQEALVEVHPAIARLGDDLTMLQANTTQRELRLRI